MKKAILNVMFFCCAILLSACATTFQPQAYLTGTLSLGENSGYKKEALHAQVRLLELNDKGETTGIIAEQYINKPPVTPVKFSLCYDKNALKKAATYAVEAQLFVEGELVMQTSELQVINLLEPSSTNLNIELKKLPHQ